MPFVRFRTILLFVAGMAQMAPGQILLEDFSSMRKNGEGTDLWAAYLGEDPGQTYMLENGMLKVFGSTQPARTDGTGGGVYMNFMPRGASGYSFPASFAQSFIRSGAWNPNANRLRFKFMCSKNVTRRADGGAVLEVGTYIKARDNTDLYPQGTHYYHQLDPNVYANRWVYTEINRVPQHRQGQDANVNWPEDPEWVAPVSQSPVHYFDGLTRFYFDTQGALWSGQVCYFDDFYFDVKTGEPESYVSSMTATYNGTAYEVGWATPKNMAVTYNVRYSTSSMKSAGFASGTDGGTVANAANAYTGVLWKSPAMAEQAGLYVAIQPVGQTAFTELFIPGTRSMTATCDVNADGVVDDKDTSAQQTQALGGSNCTNDLDGDGRCTVVDLQRVINARLGKTCRVGL